MESMKNELRLGNWVNFTYKYKGKTLSRPCKVISIDAINGVTVLDLGVSLVLQDGGDGIVLTSEILEKAGFAKEIKDGMDVWSLQLSPDAYLQWHSDGSVCIEGRNGQLIALPVYCKLVHHLQNLIHSLTGHELNIQP